MGGAASLAQIPQEVLESDIRNSFGTMSRNHLPLSSELLSSVVKNSPKYHKGPNEPKKPAYEIPMAVNSLLEKIGISSEAGSARDRGNTTNAGNIRTRKLVTHIFECLGALQHLVKANQALEEPEDFEETQSVIEVNQEAVGKLLHEMITIYTICGDTIRVLLHSSPDSARVEDNFGRLPLHVAVDRDRPWMFAIENLLQAYPEALNRRDSGGRLPLHIAVDRQEPSLDVVKLLLKRYPLAAAARRGVGRLPVHYAVFAERPNLEVVKCLLAANPDGVSTADVYGRLPIHYAVDKAVPDVAVVAYLLEKYPAGAAVRDSHMRLPLSICLERESVSLSVVRLLCAANPVALTERVGNTDKLPLQLMIESGAPNAAAIYYVARLYPEAVTLAYRQQDSPLAIALSRRSDSVVRYMLFATGPAPEHMGLLRDLNWQTRRIAFLLCRFSFMLKLPGSTKNNSHVHRDSSSSAHGAGHQSPRRRFSGTAVSVSELSVRLDRHTGVSVASHLSEDSDHTPTSPNITRFSSTVNFYARLHALDPKVFRLAVMFL